MSQKILIICVRSHEHYSFITTSCTVRHTILFTWASTITTNCLMLTHIYPSRRVLTFKQPFEAKTSSFLKSTKQIGAHKHRCARAHTNTNTHTHTLRASHEDSQQPCANCMTSIWLCDQSCFIPTWIFMMVGWLSLCAYTHARTHACTHACRWLACLIGRWQQFTWQSQLSTLKGISNKHFGSDFNVAFNDANETQQN